MISWIYGSDRQQHRLLQGRKGVVHHEAGYVYAPYVPLIVSTSLSMGPISWTYEGDDGIVFEVHSTPSPRAGLMSRYGKKMVNVSFYGDMEIL